MRRPTKLLISFLASITAIAAVWGLVVIVAWFDTHGLVGAALLCGALFAFLWAGVHRAFFR